MNIISILLGKLTCAFRKLLRLRRVHDMKRKYTPFGDGRVCQRCGHHVAVKPRKPRATKQEQK